MREILKLENASFGYGSRVVVAGVDLEVGAGDFVGIAGPNGGGKTTLFRGMLGLVPAAAGRVVRSVRSMGYVPQRESLDEVFPLTVAEVVEMGAYGRLRGLRTLGRADRDRARSLLGRVGLADRGESKFTALSGGQRQRALIARALMMDPELLLLDEPTSGVDRRAETMILHLLQELNREGLAVLLVSHQLGLLRDAVERVLWVGGGRVRAGTTEELLSPENLDRLYEERASGPTAS